ncbi:hypothetical protein ACQP2F_16290 [Actinoplanes sp. CA-030573]|uniref:hypothetical protein n=1 Tax=Actinoplanes sp. CA-030573 TaxID=3239898 RepID=UPI003D8F9411
MRAVEARRGGAERRIRLTVATAVAAAVAEAVLVAIGTVVTLPAPLIRLPGRHRTRRGDVRLSDRC